MPSVGREFIYFRGGFGCSQGSTTFWGGDICGGVPWHPEMHMSERGLVQDFGS